MFTIIISNELEKTLTKLKEKNPSLFTQVKKKIASIALSDQQSIHHYKNLKKPLQRFKRVHIKNHVLLFQVKKNTIIFETLQHHDSVYTRWNK